MQSLAEFQRDFANALLAAPGIAGAAPGLRVHRNTFMKGLVDAVLANYPTVGVLMGQEWLADAARTYALQHPPRSAVLAGYGECFPEFLREMDVSHSWPYLPGVAALDRAWTQSFLAPDAPALLPARLAGLAPEALGSLQLQLHPAARFGVYGHSAVTVWHANRPPSTPPAELSIGDDDEAALIVRNADGVTMLPLGRAGRAFVEAVLAGDDIGAAAGQALQADPDSGFSACWSALLAQGAFADFKAQGA